MIEHASELRGFSIVAAEEGHQLGHLTAVYIDCARRRVAALGFRARRLGGPQHFVPMDHVQSVGKDVVLIDRESSTVETTPEVRPPGQPLQDLLGARVATAEGRNLGTLVDLDFDASGAISELILDGERMVSIEPSEVHFADTIIVPVSYADHVVRTRAGNHAGLLRRLLSRTPWTARPRSASQPPGSP